MAYQTPYYQKVSSNEKQGASIKLLEKASCVLWYRGEIPSYLSRPACRCRPHQSQQPFMRCAIIPTFFPGFLVKLTKESTTVSVKHFATSESSSNQRAVVRHQSVRSHSPSPGMYTGERCHYFLGEHLVSGYMPS